MSFARITLITGGSRSGKSRLALEKAMGYSRRIFLATGMPIDSEMTQRIKKHQEERGASFKTIEEPILLAETIRRHAASADVILVDCLTFWLNNLFHQFSTDKISEEIQDFLAVLDEKPISLILVTNEINMGVIPPEPLSRRFVDCQGKLNQETAKRSDEVIMMVSGIPQILRQNIRPRIAAIRHPTPSTGFEVWQQRLRDIPPLDSLWREKARKRLLEQTRPEGSLGELEVYLERLVAIQHKERPSISKKRIVIFAGDHGVEVEGVSLYPKQVTQAMVYNFLSGGATINAFARSVGAEVQVVDVGVDHDFGSADGLISRKIRRGTANIKETQAMIRAEAIQALEVGWEMAHQAKEDGVEILGVGEMGIANTTAASAVVSALTKSQPQLMTGRGTGIDDAALEHKVRVIEEALRVNESFLADPFSILQSVGGLEIAAVTGFVIGAAREKIPCVIDGWIASAGALVAIHLNPNLLDYLFFAHQSDEKGHRLLLEELDIRPILKLSMRLGEGSGACLAMGILDAAVHAYREVATFQEASIAGKKHV